MNRQELAQEWQAFDGTWTEFLKSKHAALAKREKINAYHREWNRRNKEKRKAYQREYYRRNREKRKAYQREYYRRNKEKRKAYQREYRRRKRSQVLQVTRSVYTAEATRK